MKKLIIFVLILSLVFAFAGTANAATIPAGSITITAEIVDYVSALSGIAKPINTPHYENERVAVLVRIDIPQWYDTSNLRVVIEQSGISLDNNTGLAVATGNYLLFGTLYDSSGKLTITLQDDAIANASTVQAFWAALYGDRSVSTTLSFVATPPVASDAMNVPTTPVLEIPQTGDAPMTGWAVLFAGIAVACSIVLITKRKVWHLGGTDHGTKV